MMADTRTGATNQAGEVEQRVKDLLRGPDGEEYTDSGMEDAFFRWPVIANTLNEALAGPVATTPTSPTRLEDLLVALRSWEPEADDRVRPLLLAEADRREAQEYGVTDAHHVIAFLLHRLDAALATQPATSQEGGVTQADRDCAADFADAAELHSLAALLRAGKQDGHDFIAIATSYRLAATPTPPALAEDLRQAAIKAEDAMREMFRYYDGGETCDSYDGKPERNGLRKAWYDLRIALAQVAA